MIRPIDFRFNAETAINNTFQSETLVDDLQGKTLQEFNQFVNMLQQHGVNVHVFNDTAYPATPDSIFPNNWVSFHEDGTVFLYPMFAINRRLERRLDIIDDLSTRYKINTIVDLSYFEQEQKFLEGTGSMVLDRKEKIAYMCLSPRSHIEPFLTFCQKTGYQPVPFHSVDSRGYPIYHTNVMMCMGEFFCVICEESIPDANERKGIRRAIHGTGREIIPISHTQLNHFTGNMLQLKNKNNRNLLVLSEQAFRSLNHEQHKSLEQYTELIYAPLTFIEKNGGGSARCMMAEIFLPPKEMA